MPAQTCNMYSSPRCTLCRFGHAARNTDRGGILRNWCHVHMHMDAHADEHARTHKQPHLTGITGLQTIPSQQVALASKTKAPAGRTHLASKAITKSKAAPLSTRGGSWESSGFSGASSSTGCSSALAFTLPSATNTPKNSPKTRGPCDQQVKQRGMYG